MNILTKLSLSKKPKRITLVNYDGKDYKFIGAKIAETSLYRGKWRVFKTTEGKYVLNYGMNNFTNAEIADSEKGLLQLLKEEKPWGMDIRGMWDPDLAKKELGRQLYDHGLSSMSVFLPEQV